MLRSKFFILLLLASIISAAMSVSYFIDDSIDLVYVDRFDISNEAEGLNEPSGLMLSHERNALWTVSDKTKKIFKMNLVGELQKDDSFEIPDTGLEGIALDPDGKFLLMVYEEENEIIKLNIDTQEVIDRKPISEMAGFGVIAEYFIDSPPNKGLEGITWNTDTGSIFVLKESVPGLLIEVSTDLQTIRNYKLLNEDNGFRDNDVSGDKHDYSGICYDRKRNQFWIVSDKAKRLYLYDWNRNEAIRSAALAYHKKGKLREIDKAEGVTIDPDANRLYVVSDKEVRLYVFDIHE